MSHNAEKLRAAARQKAHRLAHGTREKVDSTSVDLPEPGDGSKKVYDRQAVPTRKEGGKVEGKHGHKHAGRKPRRAEGGEVRPERKAETPAESTARYKREKAEYDDMTPGQKMGASINEGVLGPRNGVPGKKRGGKVHSDEAEDRKLIDKMVKKDARTGKKDGGERMARKSGGRAKGKTNVNIVIAQPHAGAPAAMPGAGAMPHPVGPIPGGGAPMPGGAPIGVPPAGGMPGAAPAGMPPMPPGAGGPPGMMMPRKSGGRTIAMHAGSGSGPGRIEKAEIQKRADRR